MSKKVSVYALSWPWVTTLDPGDSIEFITWGAWAEYGNAGWVSVKPSFVGIDYLGEKILTVTNWSYEVSEDGGRRVFLTVKNTGPSTVITFAITYAWTDVV